MLEIFDNTCILLAKAEQKHENYTKQVFKENGFEFNPIQALVLYTLYKRDGINLSDLGKRCYLSNSTLTSVIDKMESFGLIERRLDPEDRRAYNIFLKDKAKEIREDLLNSMQHIYDRMMTDCTQEDVDAFRRVLIKIFENI